MNPLNRVDGVLHMDGAPLDHVAETYGTPSYVYSAEHFRARYAALTEAFSGVPTLACYSVKANSNLAVLKLFHDLGAGFDIVSGGELQRVLTIGADAEKVVFSGVGKRTDEIDFALKAGIGCFNVESRSELLRIRDRAQLLETSAPISIRVNPNIDANTHPYISTGLHENKFGVPMEDAPGLYELANEDDHLNVVGIDCHIGSQIQSAAPLLESLDVMLALADKLERAGIPTRHIDLGGGIGVAYQNEPDFDVASYGRAVAERMSGRNQSVLLEPGRFLVAQGGVLLTRVEYIKPGDASRKHFAVVDAAMNDLIRPALYQAWHDIIRVDERIDGEDAVWDVVGPVCESGDFLGQGRPMSLAEGELLAIDSAGAYGFVQASNYNSRGKPAEIMIEGDTHRLVRRRETVRELLENEIWEPGA